MSWFPWQAPGTSAPTASSASGIFGAANPTGGGDKAASSSASNPGESKARPHPSQLFQEEDEQAVEELLTQFPPYGSSGGGQGNGAGGGGNGGTGASAPSLVSALDAYGSYFGFLHHKPVDDTAPEGGNGSSNGHLVLDDYDDDGGDGMDGYVGPAGVWVSRSLQQSNLKAAALKIQEDDADLASPSAPLCDDWDDGEQALWKEVKVAQAPPSALAVSPAVPPSGPTPPRSSHKRRQSRRILSLSSSGPHAPNDNVELSPYLPRRLPALSQQQSSASSSSAIVPSIAHDRNHWMPDQLCKQCYHCEAPFTVFRRRHHCRLCGQVFCNACSAYFVPQPHSHVGAAAAAAVVAPTAALTASGTTAAGSTTASTATTATSSPSHHPMGATPTLPGNQTVMIRVCQFCNEQVIKQQQQNQQQQLSSAGDAAAINRSVAVFQPSSPSFLDPEAFLPKPSEGEALAPSRATRSSADHMPRIVAPNDKAGKSSGKDGAALAATSKAAALVQEGVRFTGLCAANQLEMVARELLRQHAPLVWDASEASGGGAGGLRRSKNSVWVNRLLALATKCCATVDPNVKRRGDMLDLRPYVKIKTISGGSLDDCAYVSGILFRKTPRHRIMCREIVRPRIMVLSGGIDFHSTRSTEQQYRMASLETLFEQEDTYLEILVSKILKHKPNVLFLGRGVSGKGQDLLVKAGVVVVQYVKPGLLHRIARQTGAAIISSPDHISVMGGSGGGAGSGDGSASSPSNVVVGRCHRFRLVTFRDNEVWMDLEDDDNSVVGKEDTAQEPAGSSAPEQLRKPGVDSKSRGRRSIRAVLNDPKLSNQERQAALAAIKLGEKGMEGAAAMNMGLASRFVARNYILIEGCPKNLGCTVVLRGSHRAALKQVKMVFRFLVNMAYNLKLETAYFRERSVRIQPDFELQPKFAYSTSLCVDYGTPATGGKKIRPWNGGNESMPRIESGEFTAFDHQAILVTSVWMTDKTQCCPAEVKGIVYYSIQDVALGQFLRDSCFNLSLRCQNPNCKKSVLDHSLSFVHNDGLLKITVEEMEEELPPPQGSAKDHTSKEIDGGIDGDVDRPIATWTYCSKCKKVVSPLTYLSDTTWKYSFGKFLEVFFYNRDAIMNAPYAECSCQVQSSTQLYFGCGKLAARFGYEPVRPFGVYFCRFLPSDAAFQKIETLRRLDLISEESAKLFVKFDKHLERVSREARSLFNSPVNRPEHLQTVLSALNNIGSDVDETAKTLHDKITSAMESCRQQSDADSLNQALFQFPWSTRRFIFMLTSAWNERLSASGHAIVAMKKIAAAAGRSDGVIGQTVGDPLNDSLTECMKRLRKLNDQYARYKVSDITQVLPTLPGLPELQQDGDYDDEFDDPDTSIDFADGVDADVLASRRRLLSRTASSTSSAASTPTRPIPTKSLGTRRREMPRPETVVTTSTPKPTTGGAVKSAITRFFNRGGRDFDNYTVDLGVFAEGRPRLVPGVHGLVVPVSDDQLSSIIAYSLASVEYAKQFKYFSRNETTNSADGDSALASDRSVKDSTLGVETQRRGQPDQQANAGSAVHSQQQAGRLLEGESKDIERRMLGRSKSHIAHTYRDFDEKGQVTCKFKCTTYWATQFHAVRQVFLSRSPGKGEGSAVDGGEPSEIEQSYVESLSSTAQWDASGGKSGASFSKSSDGRFVIKCISRTELQMFLDCAPAYFEYLTKAFFHGLPTVLCKIVGVYQIGIHNRLTGKRTMEQVAVMANIFYDRKITRVFDLKGSLRGRFAAQVQGASAPREDGNGPTSAHSPPDTPSNSALDVQTRPLSRNNNSEWADEPVGREAEESNDDRASDDPQEQGIRTLLDGDFLAFTEGRPMPLTDRAKAIFQMSILNDTLFLSIINVLDYSILVGVDESEEKHELVVGIIDFMRQYDILKQMERVGKSLPMVVGSEAPTIIQPPLYKQRFTNAMERYFMTVPSKWTAI